MHFVSEKLQWNTLAALVHSPFRDSSCIQGILTIVHMQAFYMDFARVADDESRHFGWCIQRLAELGHEYGDMPAHDLLWEGCRASAVDLSARLAIVPLSQEARGLDAGPRLVQRLVGLGDNRSAAIVRRIAEEERAHVAVGVQWFKRVCKYLWLHFPHCSSFSVVAEISITLPSRAR